MLRNHRLEKLPVFDREGALLVYATQGEVLAARLDRAGARVGDAQRVASSDGRVRALVAGAAAGRVAVAWLRTEGGSARVERALGAGRPTVFGPPTELESWPTTEPTAPAAPDTTTVSPAWGLPASSRPK